MGDMTLAARVLELEQEVVRLGYALMRLEKEVMYYFTSGPVKVAPVVRKPVIRKKVVKPRAKRGGDC